MEQGHQGQAPPEQSISHGPRGYRPAIDNPETDRDALGETLNNPNRLKLTDAGKTEGDQ